MNKTSHIIKKEGRMNVDGVVYASNSLFELIKKDKTLNQVKNVASLPGIISNSIALPDAHQGYGFPIGGVAAFDLKKGVVSPGGVGYDINCGVRLLKTNLTRKDIQKKEKKLLGLLYSKIPSGVGRGSPFQLSKKQLNQVLDEGASWLVNKGYGLKSDLNFCEEKGSLKADSSLVSEKAKKRGIGQLGTLGAGNHFLEVEYVEKLFDKKTAKAFGLKEEQIVVLIHCGSRGLGHQVASDYIKKMEDEYGSESFVDRELINAPIQSQLGKEYILSMNAAANFAFANRQLITHWTREVFKEIFPSSKLELLYDVCHNIAKIESHKVGGKNKKVCVHRKGATRSFGKERKELPREYRLFGQPVLLPGSMGTSSYVLVGTKQSEMKTFASAAHGAGRHMSRFSAIKKFSGEKIKKELSSKGIFLQAGSQKGISEEAPGAYKDVDEVVEVLQKEKLSLKVAKLKPILVVKG